MLAIYNENREVVTICRQNFSGAPDIEITGGDIPEKDVQVGFKKDENGNQVPNYVKDVDNKQLRKWGCFVYTIDEQGIMTKRTDEQVKEQPSYNAYQDSLCDADYEKEVMPLIRKYLCDEIQKKDIKDKVDEIKLRHPHHGAN